MVAIAASPNTPHRVAAARSLAVALAATCAWTIWGLVGWLGSGPLAAPGPAPGTPLPVAASLHVVEPGDTLWSIARSWQPAGDVRPLVDRLARGQHGRALEVGETVVRPAIAGS